MLSLTRSVTSNSCKCAFGLPSKGPQVYSAQASALPNISRRSVISAFLWSCARRPAAALDVRKTYDAAAGSYDLLDGGPTAALLGFTQLRRQLLEGVSGEICEVAVGTGLNLPFYSAARVSSYTGIDVSPKMLAKAKDKAASLARMPRASFLEGSVEALPFPDDHFDAVVSTFSLCVFANPVGALQEMRRVVKPEGRLLLLEHSRSSWGPLARYQKEAELMSGILRKFLPKSLNVHRT